MARILVAEDEAAVRDLVVRALTTFGHEVVAVPDGGAALAELGSEPFDMLLTDIVMPVMDGIALALKCADDFPGMPVLLMSGYAHERARAYNLSDLIAHVLDKPFSLEDLRKAVSETLVGSPGGS